VLLVAPLWLLRGKARFKDEIFARAAIDPEALPYNAAFLDFLKDERKHGRSLILTTATSRSAAERVAQHVGIFDHVMASDESVNLAGRRKAEALVHEFGERGFAYAANAYVDLDVWRQAAAAHVVQPAAGLTKRVEAVCHVASVYESKSKSKLRLALKAMRPHQWAKNALIFAPVVFAHRITHVDTLLAALTAFLAFTLVSSSVYLVNDLLDLESDRRHVDNRRRPFASGDLPLQYGIFMAPALIAAGALVGASLSWAFLGVLAGYFVVTSAYSFRLKQVVLADVLILAFLYAWRVFAGAIATDIALTSWFLAFFGFLFLSLALVKRCSELILTMRHNQKENARRGYWVSDLQQLVSFGSASGYIAVLVLALYINEQKAAYARPQVLWMLCPFMLYWVSRMWLMASRGQMTSDPLVFSLKDRVSYVMIGIMVVIWLVASGSL
jgi:4-hydroxybenzoate polyprenyltransferase